MKKYYITIVLALFAAQVAWSQQLTRILHPSKYYIELHNILETRDNHLIINCPIYQPETGNDMGLFLYKTTLDGEIIDSVFVASDERELFFMERHPFDENSNIFVTWAKDAKGKGVNLKMDFFNDNMEFTEHKLIPLHDADIYTAAYCLDSNNDLIVHFVVINDGRYLVKVGLDGTIKNKVRYISDAGYTTYFQDRHVCVYNKTPLEYCVWYIGQSDKIYRSVFDSEFNLLSNINLQYKGNMYEQIVYDKDETYLLSSRDGQDYHLQFSKFTKDDELIECASFEAQDQINPPFSIQGEKGKKGGYYYSYVVDSHGSDIAVSKLNEKLEVEWTRYCMDNPSVFHWGYCMRTLKNGGVAVGGWDSFNSPQDLRFFLLILTDEGASCPEMEAYVKPYYVYPNPASSHVSLQVSPDTKIVKAELFDANGRLVLSQTDELTELNVSNLSAGSYLMKLHSNSGKVYSEKIVKE